MRSARFVLAGALLAAIVSAGSSARAFDPFQRAERAVQRSRAAMADGDTTRAIDEMLKAQALAPDDARIRHALGEVFYDGQQFPSAQRVFEGLLRSDAGARDGLPLGDEELLYNSGNAAFENQDLQRALEFYTEAVLSAPPGTRPSEDLLYNLELTQSLLESQSSESGGEGSDSQDSDQEQQEQQDPSVQSEQDPSQPSESEAAPDSSSGESPPAEDQEESAPPDSTQSTAPPDSLQTAQADSLSPPPQGMSPEEAMRLLEALDQDEEELRNSIQRRLRGGESEDDGEW